MPDKNTQAKKPIRPRCNECARPLTVCLCSALKKIENVTDILVLQHKSEKKHALNTVSLMQKCLTRITVLSGEEFSENAELLHFIATKKPLLLYPAEDAKVLTPEDKKLNFNALILIDGTWKKALKIYELTPPLKALPAYKLHLEQKGNYRIRSSKRADSLSTLEAAVAALKIMESDLSTGPLVEAFTKMIDLQIEKMGQKTYQANYLKIKD